MKTVIKPCGHHVLVAPLEWEQTTEWGFSLTPHEESETAKLERAGRMYGTLVAVGPQAWRAHATALVRSLPKGLGSLLGGSALDDWATVGDTIMYSRYAGKNIYDPDTGQELYLIHDEDILAVLPPKEEWAYSPAEKEKKL